VTLHPKGALSEAEYVRTQPRSGRHPQVRVLYRPPKQYNPNLLPIGHGFGFIVLMEEIEDW